MECQLYKYKENFLEIEKKDYSSFTHSFTEGITPETVSWLNFHSIQDVNSIFAICKNLKIFDFIVKNIFKEIAEIKIEESDSYIFFRINTISPLIDDHDSSRYQTEKITFILGNNYLISFQEKQGDTFNEIRKRIQNNEGTIRKRSADFLLFRLLETILDNYYYKVQFISKEMLSLEKELNTKKEIEILKKIKEEKTKLIQLENMCISLKNIIVQLKNSKKNFISSSTEYYSNLYFYCENILEEISANKQNIDDNFNLHFAVQNQRMNNIIKVLTIVSSVFIPLTFIAGVYGMNFENMPELKNPIGYYVTLNVMFVLALFMLTYFWKKNWFK